MIVLQPFKQEDFPLLIKWINSEDDLIQFAGTIFKFPLTNVQLDRYLEDLNRSAFKIINKIDNTVIGHSEIYFNENKTAKLCRILIGEPKFRGKGFGQKIVNELVRVSIENYGVKIIELNVYDWNISAIKCYEKVGFKVVEKSVPKTIEINNQIWTAINMRFTKNN